MADSATAGQPDATTPVKSAAGKKVASKATKKPKAKPSHPPTGEMVNAAIAGLKERGGSSLQAIKKYVAANYKVDAEKMAPFIRKYLKSAVASGALTQPKGKGASGSFKISVKEGSKITKSEKKPKTAAAKPKKPSAAKKPKVAKSSPEKKIKPAVKKAKAKTPTKAKKVSKPPTKKPKSPKPKKAAVKKPKTPKKSPAKKK